MLPRGHQRHQALGRALVLVRVVCFGRETFRPFVVPVLPLHSSLVAAAVAVAVHCVQQRDCFKHNQICVAFFCENQRLF